MAVPSALQSSAYALSHPGLMFFMILPEQLFRLSFGGGFVCLFFMKHPVNYCSTAEI